MSSVETNATIAALKEGGVTQRQYEALEIFISESLDATVKAKKVLLWFLRQSNFLKRNIALSVLQKEGDTPTRGLAYEVGKGVHDMGNMLFAAFNLMGFPKAILSHCGVATKISDQLIKLETGWDQSKQEEVPTIVNGYTIWLSKEHYSKNVELLEYNEIEINQTKLRNTYYEFSSSQKEEGQSRCLTPEFYEDENIPVEIREVKLRE